MAMSIKPRVRLLHLEDNQCDRVLIQITLADAGIDHQMISAQNKAEFTAALDRGGFDIILSDSSLPAFDGQDALRMVKEKCPEIPFLFVTGYCPAERATRLKEAGAKAALCKSDLASLADAVVAALKAKRPN